MHNDKRFIHTRTGEVIEVTGTDAELSKIVTITATGRQVRPRTVKTASLKTDYLSRRGTPWRAAYVAVSCLPEGHAMAPVPAEAAAPVQASGPEFTFDLPDFAKMTNEELSAYGYARKAEAALADDLHEKAKDELKSRTTNSGLRVFGNVAVVAKSNRRFSGKRAKAVLSPSQYSAICVSKPDSTLAKKVLDEDSDLYKSITDDHGWTMEIRPATESDFEKMAEDAEVASAKAAVDADSMIPDDWDTLMGFPS